MLTKLVENILSGKDFSAIALNENPKKDSDSLFREAMVKLCVLGLPLQIFDPYSLPAKELPEKKSALSVRLSGTNYVSDATRNDFENAQPAIGAISAGFFRLLRDKGVSVDFAAGHSFLLKLMK